MAWWASGNARSPQGPQAREAGRLDRRTLGTQRAGVGPAPSQGIFIGNLVIVHGTGPTSGVFVYNGAPRTGNPPQVAIVPTGVTTDPYGNAITSSKILIQGNVITESGGIFRTAATAPLIQLDGPHNAYLEYNAGAVLTETIAPVATSDGLGNTVQAGFASYTGTGLVGQLVSATLRLFNTADNTAGLLTGGGGGVTLSSGKNLLAQTTSVLQLLSSGSPTGAAQAVLVAGGTPTPATAALLEVQGSQALKGIATPASPPAGNVLLFADTSGILRMLIGLAGDTSIYAGAYLIQRTTTTQVFTLASAIAITSLSVPLGVASYHVRLKVFWQPSGVIGSTHVHNFAFSGTATGNVNGQCWQAQAASAVQQTALNAGAGNNLTANLTSPTHVNFAGWTELEADITVTVAGTLTHTITLTTAGDDITTSAGTFWEIKPL